RYHPRLHASIRCPSRRELSARSFLHVLLLHDGGIRRRVPAGLPDLHAECIELAPESSDGARRWGAFLFCEDDRERKHARTLQHMDVPCRSSPSCARIGCHRCTEGTWHLGVQSGHLSWTRRCCRAARGQRDFCCR
ncbi:hypothetical protein HKX48_002609, partial [Thoreauomyces humboldtii]